MKIRRDELKLTPRRSQRRKMGDLNDTLDRQAKSLDRHEAVIARHTRIQTYVAVVTTGVLAAITFMQYRAGERQVALEYAKVSNQYEVLVDYRLPPPDPYGIPVNVSSKEFYRIPENVKFSRTAGLGVIDMVTIDQEFYIVPVDASGMDISETSCAIWISYWFEVGDARQTEFALSSLAENAVKNVLFESPRGEPVKFSAGRTSIQVSYRDVFGGKRFDEIIGEDASFEVFRSEGGWISRKSNESNLGSWGVKDIPFKMMIPRNQNCEGLLAE